MKTEILQKRNSIDVCKRIKVFFTTNKEKKKIEEVKAIKEIFIKKAFWIAARKAAKIFLSVYKRTMIQRVADRSISDYVSRKKFSKHRR